MTVRPLLRRLCLGLALASIVMPAVVRPAPAQQQDRQRIAVAGPAELLEIVKRHVWPDVDLATRLEAQHRLVQLGRESPGAVVPLLVEALSTPRLYGKKATHQRIAVIETLRDIGPAAEAAMVVLVEVLEDPEEWNDWVAMAARMALGQIGTADAKAAIAESARKDAEGRAKTASAAEQAKSARQIAFLIRQELRRPRPSGDVIAAGLPELRAAGSLAAAALPTLFRAHKDPRVGRRARLALSETIRALGASDVAAANAPLPGEIDLLDDIIADIGSADDFISAMAMSELGEVGPSARALEVLIGALDEGRSPGAAANALGGFGPAAASAAPHLVAHFADSLAGANAIQAFGRIGARDQVGVAALRRIARTDSAENRGMAAKVLGQLGVLEALPDLERALDDERKYTRILAAQAISRFGESAAPAVDNLGRLLGEPDDDLRGAAIAALGAIGPAARPLATLIARDLEAGDPRLRAAAERALRKIDGATAARPRAEEALLAGDQVATRRFLAGNDMAGLSGFLRTLPERRGIVVAGSLVAEADRQAALIGAAYMISRGVPGAAVPRLAGILLEDENGPDRYMAFARSLVHSDDQARYQGAMAALAAELQRRLEEAPPRARERWRELIAPGKPD